MYLPCSMQCLYRFFYAIDRYEEKRLFFPCERGLVVKL